MSIITRNYRFDPVDILVFRDGMPFNQNDHGQVRMHSIFPPNQETMAGALRAAYARNQGWLGGNWARIDRIKTAAGKDKKSLSQYLLDILGNGQNIQNAAITFGPVHLMVRAEGGWGKLYSVPHDFGINESKYSSYKQGNKTLDTITFSRLDFDVSLKVEFDNGSEEQAHSKNEVYLTPLYNHWVTKNTLLSIFSGQEIETKQIYYGAKSEYESWLNRQFTPLWSEESRTGIQRCHNNHTAVEGMLYQVNGIRLENDVAIAIDVNLDLTKCAETRDWEPCSSIPLGAEGHFATIEEGNYEYNESGTVVRNTNTQYCITLTSPAIINPAKMKPGTDWSDEGLDKFKGAAMNRSLTRGSWSSITGSQQNETMFPAGATLYFAASSNRPFDSVKLDEALLALGEKQEWGYGRYILRNL